MEYVLHVAKDLEAAVGFLSVFALVEAAEFLPFRDAEAHRLLDDVEDQAGASKARQGVGRDTDELCEHAVVARHIEDTHGNRAPHTVHQVNRESTDRVVQVKAVEHEHCTYDEHTSDGTDNPGGERGHHVSSGGNRHETGKASVEGHGGVGLLRYNPARERSGNDACDSGEVRGHQNPASSLRVAREGRTGVESPPTEPEHEHTDGCERNVVGRDSVHLAVHVLADTRSKDHHAGKRCPATHGVDERRTGEVVEASLADGAKPATAPCPATHDGVNQGNVNEGKDQEGVELHAFGNSTGNDCRGSGGEHGLEQPVGKQRKVAVVGRGEVGRIGPVANAEACETENPVEGARIHEAKAEQGVHRDTNGGDRDVLEGDVGGALGAHEARFNAGESKTHDEHQHGADHNPDVFCHKDGVADRYDLCNFVHCLNPLCLNPLCLTNRIRSRFAGADSNALFQARDENLSIADFAGTGPRDNRVDAGLHKVVVHCDLQANLLEQIHFGNDTAEALVITLLLAATQNVCDGHLENVFLVKGLLYKV